MEAVEIYETPIPVGETILTKQCYSIEDIELVLGISRPTVMKLLKKNEFRWFKIGAVYRISKSSFDEWLQNNL